MLVLDKKIEITQDKRRSNKNLWGEGRSACTIFKDICRKVRECLGSLILQGGKSLHLLFFFLTLITCTHAFRLWWEEINQIIIDRLINLRQFGSLKSLAHLKKCLFFKEKVFTILGFEKIGNVRVSLELSHLILLFYLGLFLQSRLSWSDLPWWL